MEIDEPPLLEIKDLQVRRGSRTVLDVPYLAIHKGELLAIMGPNGAGKSTLLQTLALLQKPVRGTIRIAGIEATARGQDLVAIRRRMAMVFQEPLLLDMTVAENVQVGLNLRHVPTAESRQRAKNWLQRFGVAHLAKVQARHLSGGEAQRTSLARAFALQPEVLLLDEPFSALDPPTRAEIVDSLALILHETGQTTLFVTHDRNEALTLGDRVGVMLAGHLAQMGHPAQVFAAPANAAVAAFLGIENILPGRIQNQEEGIAHIQITQDRASNSYTLSILGAETGSGNWPSANAGREYSPNVLTPFTPMIEAVSDLPTGTSVLVCIQAEDITLTAQGQSTTSASTSSVPLAKTPADSGSGTEHNPPREPLSSARNSLSGHITRLEIHGPLVRVTVDCGTPNRDIPMRVLITRRSMADLALQPGQPVFLTFKASGVHLIPTKHSPA
ncbi:MAG: ABC transporter ATP-binding protein [Chloroflexi bacterium]|nr:ABC transporter ATP-binding protein [Chloroflexota bacterium]